MKQAWFPAVLALFIGCTGLSRAASYSNEVLAIGAGARPLGMGGAFAGLADDSSAVYWNPAGLTRVEHVDLSATQQGREADNLSMNSVGSSYTFLSAAMTVPHFGSFGLGFLRFGVSDIPLVSGLDSSGAPVQTGTFANQDLAFFVSYGRRLFPGFSAGLTAKTLSGGTQGVTTGSGDASYSYLGADLGLLTEFGTWTPALEGLSLGVNVQDALNGGVAWKNTASNPHDTVDLNVKTGLAYTPRLSLLEQVQGRWSVVFDVDPKYSPATLYHLGSEFWYRDTVALRAGLRMFGSSRQSAELSAGFSFRIYMLQLDYAYINYELTPVQYLSVSGKF